MWYANVFGLVCLSMCLYLRNALTFENLDLESSFFDTSVHLYVQLLFLLLMLLLTYLAVFHIYLFSMIFVNRNCCWLSLADSFVPDSSDAAVWKRLQDVQTYCSEPVPGHHRRPHVWCVLYVCTAGVQMSCHHL